MDVDPEDLQEMTNFIEETNTVLEKHAHVEAKVAEAAPALVDKLIKAGMLTEQERSNALSNLQNPLQVLAALEQIATTKIASAEEAKKTNTTKMGSSGGVTNAGHSKVASDRSSEPTMAEVDRNFLNRFGL